MTEDECNAVPCSKPSTHTLKTRVLADENFDEWENEVEYCLDHAIYFAGWLPYCYPGEYEVISITPPASELFGRK